MEKTYSRPRKTVKQPENPFKCRDCRHSYDWHSKALDGHLILCRCPLDVKSEHGRWCKFLSDPACPQFVKREEDSNNGEKE